MPVKIRARISAVNGYCPATRVDNAALLETVLEAGDVLYNPPYYWHHVSNPVSSIGVGCRGSNMRAALRASPMLAIMEVFNTNPNLIKGMMMTLKDFNTVLATSRPAAKNFQGRK